MVGRNLLRDDSDVYKEDENNNIDKYNFYYDESEHSRKINLITINAHNYYDNFFSVIVGWKGESEELIFRKYEVFEEKHKERKSKGEIKSQTLQQSQFEFGLASMNKSNVRFLNDFLSIIDDNILIYFSVISKIEFIISQVFADYRNDILVDIDAMKYTIVKAILMYRPAEILDSVFENTGELVGVLKKFFSERIQHNKQNLLLKKRENIAFEQILILIDSVQDVKTVDWEYNTPFDGFKNYLNEQSIFEYSLYIDKEGGNSNTLNAAKRVGIKNATEVDSMDSIGVRISDMLAGVISKLQKALHNSLRYTSMEGIPKKILLREEWIKVTQEQLAIYKYLYSIICELNNAWYKSYSGRYSDDMISLIALLNYMNQFSSVKDIEKTDLNLHAEYLNSYTCKLLEEHYEKISNKLQLTPVLQDKKEYYLNQKGAKVYHDIRCQPFLKLDDGIRKYKVHSVGISNQGVPLATIKEHGKMNCYRLPDELGDWALSVVRLAFVGTNLFPADVVFQKRKGEVFADIL